MKIIKVINNNIVSAAGDKGEELIVMGRGLGFGSKAGQEIANDKIEKVFYLDDESAAGKFKELLRAMPLNHIKISVDVIEYANTIIKQRLNPNIYITLTDHIDFAITRFKDGMVFPNPLLQEVKSFYPSEYLIGEYAIDLIRRELDVDLKPDEAASIALHFVNAEYDTDMNSTMKITSTIGEALAIIQKYIGMELDEQSLHYIRLVTHLKFLVQRIFTNQMLNDGQVELAEMIRKMYPKEYECSQKIVDYISEKYEKYKVSEDELAYLAVHIRRIYVELYKVGEEE